MVQRTARLDGCVAWEDEEGVDEPVNDSLSYFILSLLLARPQIRVQLAQGGRKVCI